MQQRPAFQEERFTRRLPGVWPLREPICVDIPSGDAVRVFSSVLARMKSRKGMETKTDPAYDSGIMNSRRVRDREKVPLIRAENTRVHMIRIVPRTSAN